MKMQVRRRSGNKNLTGWGFGLGFRVQVNWSVFSSGIFEVRSGGRCWNVMART